MVLNNKNENPVTITFQFCFNDLSLFFRVAPG